MFRDDETHEEIRRTLGLRLDAPLGYVLDAIYHLKFRPGTKVRTRPDGALHDKDYTPEAQAKRKWGVTGKIVEYHNGHGLFFEVKHDGFRAGTGTYDPDEIEVVA